MIGPLIHYLYHGFYFNDNHDPVYEAPYGQLCWFFVKDCSRIIEAFGENINDHLKGEILYHKLMTTALIDTIGIENVVMLRQNREIEMDVLHFTTHFYQWLHNLNASEELWVMNYLRHLNNLVVQEKKINEDDLINIILRGTHGHLVVKNENMLCIL